MRIYENILKTSENRLEQRAYYIPGGKAEYILLNGTWNFAFFESEEMQPEVIEKWDEILRMIQEELPPLTELTALYDKIGLPRSMREIGLDEDTLPMTFRATKDIRDKYVLSRLAWDLGVLDEMV